MSRIQPVRELCSGTVECTMSRATRTIALAACTVTLAAMLGSAAQIDSKAVELVTPENIKWVRNAAGTNETAVLFGDPEKPGPYVIRLRWLPGNMSRPHYHQSEATDGTSFATVDVGLRPVKDDENQREP